MKFYIIMSIDKAGEQRVMRDAYTSQEAAMVAIMNYRLLDDGRVYYFSEITLVK